MKAIILASGPGRRLRPLTANKPKCLIKIKGKTILGRILDSLLENEIIDIVITTGHLAEEIKSFMDDIYSQVEAVYAYNPLYDSTNYIYSMWLAKDVLKDADILYLHGDVIYDPELIKKIIEFPRSGALVNKKFIPEKDFKAKIRNNRITKIGVDVSDKNAGFCLPIYKILKDDFSLWMKQIEKFVKNKNLDCYAEEALNQVFDKIDFYPVYYEQEFGMEIDDFEDLEKAKKILEK